MATPPGQQSYQQYYGSYGYNYQNYYNPWQGYQQYYAGYPGYQGYQGYYGQQPEYPQPAATDPSAAAITLRLPERLPRRRETLFHRLRLNAAFTNAYYIA